MKHVDSVRTQHLCRNAGLSSSSHTTGHQYKVRVHPPGVLRTDLLRIIKLQQFTRIKTNTSRTIIKRRNERQTRQQKISDEVHVAQLLNSIFLDPVVCELNASSALRQRCWVRTESTKSVSCFGPFWAISGSLFRPQFDHFGDRCPQIP